MPYRGESNYVYSKWLDISLTRARSLPEINFTCNNPLYEILMKLLTLSELKQYSSVRITSALAFEGQTPGKFIEVIKLYSIPFCVMKLIRSLSVLNHTSELLNLDDRYGILQY